MNRELEIYRKVAPLTIRALESEIEELEKGIRDFENTSIYKGIPKLLKERKDELSILLEELNDILSESDAIDGL